MYLGDTVVKCHKIHDHDSIKLYRDKCEILQLDYAKFNDKIKKVDHSKFSMKLD